MKNVLLLTFLSFFTFSLFSQGPCNIQAFVNPVQISCGDSAVLSAFGNGSGNVAFQENFNSGSPVGWQFTQNVTIANNTCGVPAPDGSNFMWMGDASVNPRDMTTVPFDLTLGGSICFEMRYSIQGDASPCEGPDEPQEGVYVQYSINGGANWTTIEYWSPNGGNSSQLTNWNQYCLVLPPAAMTANTMIRWHQDAVSGAEFDHWGIDNVIITLNDPNFIISWLHDGYSYGFGSSGGPNPNVVAPTTTTTYSVQITDGTNTCNDQIQLVVTNPVIIMEVGPDTSICPGECVNIDATAYWELEAPAQKTFVNDVSQIISSGAGSSVVVPVSVDGVNLTSIQPGSILEVCITSMTYFGQGFVFPTGLVDVTVGDFIARLNCPGGASIVLIPSGVTTSTATQGYTQTCFTMSTPNNIAASAPPYTGTFAPSQPFDNLVGCQANGIWTMSFTPTSPLSFGIGGFQGWSITIDDPGVSAPVSYSWSPTTNMTNSNTLTPTVCPAQTTTYTLTATTAPGCQPATADVTITIPNSCCQIEYDNIVPLNPSCGASDGGITINVIGAITGVQYSIDNGVTFQTSNTFTGLAAGSYTVVVRDDNNCPITQTVVLSNPNVPVIDNIQVLQLTCAGNNGSITISASAGAGSYTYSINGGTSFQSGNTFTNLAAGSYAIVVEDADGCSVTGSATLSTPPNPTIVSTNSTPADCGSSNGSASVVATGGTGPFTYSWSSGGSSATVANISSGSYSVTVTDSLGCTATGNVVVTNIGGPTVAIVTQSQVACFGQSNGSVEVEVTQGGTAPFTYVWAPSGGTGSTASGLAAGTYTVAVTDADDCVGSTTVIITEPAQLVLSATQTPTACGQSTGTASASVSGGVGPYTYTWSPSGGGSNVATALAAGNYTVNVEDNSGCEQTASVTIQTVVVDSLLAFTVETTPESCAAKDGSATVQVTDGVAPYSFQWDVIGGSDSSSVFGLTADTYNVTVSDLCYSETVTVTIEKSFVQPDKKLPNVFTPNSKDGINDVYQVADNFSGVNNFYCVIYNRWGYTVHKTEDKEINWAPKNVSDGVYFIVVTYTDCLGEAEKIASTITLASGK